MQSIITRLFLMLLLVYYVAATDSEATPAPAPPTYSIPKTPLKNYIFTVSSKQDFWLKIPANLTTGYNHYLTYLKGDKSIVKLLNVNKDGTSKNYVLNTGDLNVVGGGGYNLFKFTPLKTGQIVYNVIYKRSWEKTNLYEIKVTFNIR